METKNSQPENTIVLAMCQEGCCEVVMREEGRWLDMVSVQYTHVGKMYTKFHQYQHVLI